MAITPEQFIEGADVPQRRIDNLSTSSIGSVGEITTATAERLKGISNLYIHSIPKYYQFLKEFEKGLSLMGEGATRLQYRGLFEEQTLRELIQDNTTGINYLESAMPLDDGMYLAYFSYNLPNRQAHPVDVQRTLTNIAETSVLTPRSHKQMRLLMGDGLRVQILTDKQRASDNILEELHSLYPPNTGLQLLQ